MNCGESWTSWSNGGVKGTSTCDLYFVRHGQWCPKFMQKSIHLFNINFFAKILAIFLNLGYWNTITYKIFQVHFVTY